MTQDSYDSKYDRWMEKIDNVEDKTCDDIPPDEKLALFDKAIEMYRDVVSQCEDVEALDEELYHNSDEARQHLADALKRRDEYFRQKYTPELDEWERRVATGDVPRKYKTWARPAAEPAQPVDSPHPPASKEEMRARFAELMKDAPKKETPAPAAPKKAGCLVYFGFLLAGFITTLYYCIA